MTAERSSNVRRADAGWVGILVPETYGGAGLGVTAAGMLLSSVAGSAGAPAIIPECVAQGSASAAEAARSLEHASGRATEGGARRQGRPLPPPALRRHASASARNASSTQPPSTASSVPSSLLSTYCAPRQRSESASCDGGWKESGGKWKESIERATGASLRLQPAPARQSS